MKKLLLLLTVLAGLSTVSFAQCQVDSAAIERAAKQGLDTKYAEERLLEKNAWNAWKIFCKQANKFAYHNYSFMFQSMDALRQAYMALRKASPDAAVAFAPRINELVYLNGHKRAIRLVSYINMETCNLAPSEQEKFDAFGRALAEDLRKAKPLPADFVGAVTSFREYVEDSREMNVSWVLQGLMPVMDIFNRTVQEQPDLAPVLAKEIQKPIQAGWGKWVVTSQFITDHACEMWTIQDDLEAFGNKLVQLSK